MDYYDWLKLKESRGGGECSHPRLEKIYYTGAFLISYACVQCGREFSIAEKMELAVQRKRKTAAE